MHTDKYKTYLKALKNAQNAFDKSPSKKTATGLSDLKSVRFSDADKFTAEHITMRQINRKADNKKLGSMMFNLLNTIAIERKFEKGMIDDKTYIALHKHNDQVNPIN